MVMLYKLMVVLELLLLQEVCGSVDALNWLYKKGEIKQIPISNFVSAVSVGIVDNHSILDLCFEEDYRASVDMNVVMTDDNRFIEIQGTGEKSTFSKGELCELLNLAEKGNHQLIAKQKEVLGNISQLIGRDVKGENYD